MIKVFVVLGIDEELSCRAVNLCGAPHGDGSGFVLQLIGCFIDNRFTGRLLLHIRSEAAPLDHEPLDDTMEDGAIIVAGIGVIDKVFDTDRSLNTIKFQDNFTVGGFNLDHRFITHNRILFFLSGCG